MADVKVTINGDGLYELLKSQPIMDACIEQANAVASYAGEGYEVDSFYYPERACARVKAVTRKAIQDAYENNTLLYAIGGG